MPSRCLGGFSIGGHLNPDLCLTPKNFHQGSTINNDSRSSVKPFPALHAAFTVLDGAQTLAPHLQVIGVAVLFREMCLRLNLEISQVLNAAERMSHDADSNYSHHLGALHAYIDNEVKNKS